MHLVKKTQSHIVKKMKHFRHIVETIETVLDFGLKKNKPVSHHVKKNKHHSHTVKKLKFTTHFVEKSKTLFGYCRKK